MLIYRAVQHDCAIFTFLLEKTQHDCALFAFLYLRKYNTIAHLLPFFFEQTQILNKYQFKKYTNINNNVIRSQKYKNKNNRYLHHSNLLLRVKIYIYYVTANVRNW
jgi:hypothetical protein